MRLYVDNEATSATRTGGGAVVDDADFLLGTVSVLRVNGTLDAVGWWHRVLTDEEITELYNAGAGLEHPFK